MTSLINQVAKEDAEKFGAGDADAAPAADDEGSAE